MDTVVVVDNKSIGAGKLHIVAATHEKDGIA